MPVIHYGNLAFRGFVVLLASVSACREIPPTLTAPPQRPPPAVQPQPVVVESQTPEPLPQAANTDEPSTLPAERGWVQVEILKPQAEGGWATGDFLEARNKIEIKTRGVRQFSIDMRKLRINWDRLVVIGIDGRNAELRRRNTDILHIARDEHRKWVVLEP